MWNKASNFLVGDRVHVRGRNGWQPAVLTRQNEDGKWDCMCEDGNGYRGLLPDSLRPEPAYPDVNLGATLRDPWGGGGDPAAAPSARAPQRQPPPSVKDVPKPKWSPNSRVSADYCGLGFYHDASISAINSDGSYAVLYDDGLTEERVPPGRIAPPGGPVQNHHGNGEWDPPPPKPAADRRRPRASSPPPPARSREPREPRAEVLREGSRAQGNWGALGYWHPCTVLGLLPGGAFRLQYDDGFEEDAPAECVLPAGAKPASEREARGGGGGGGGMRFDNRGCLDSDNEGAPLGGGGFGAAAVQRGSARGDEPDDGSARPKGHTPLAPRRRRQSINQDAEKARRQFENERKARLEVFKLRPEDKQWAAQHGLTGDRGLFQGMIVRYRNANPMAQSVHPSSLASSDAPIAVFVRKRPMLPDELKQARDPLRTSRDLHRSSRDLPRTSRDPPHLA